MKKCSKVLVIGDTLLDLYWNGTVDRISPEAPVPIFQYTNEYKRLGGAANVATNIKTLSNIELDIKYCGFLSWEIVELLREYGILGYISEYLEPEQILKKIRLVSNNHQILRLDRGLQYHKEDCVALQKTIKQISPENFDLIIISDYNKGTLTPSDFSCIEHILDSDVPLIVESKHIAYKTTNPNSIFKCNKKEFEWMQNELVGFDRCIITQGKDGCIIISEKPIPAEELKPLQIADVTGAGDTFLAALAVNYLETGKFDARQMAIFANKAASEKVKHFGTTTVERKWLEK